MFWAIVGFAFIAWFVLVLLFTPRIDYHVTFPLRPDSDDFLHVFLLASREVAVTERLRRDFEADLAASDEITLAIWRARSPFEKLVGPVCWILERQQ